MTAAPEMLPAAVSYSPRTGEPLHSASATSPARLDETVEAARVAAPVIADASPAQRQEWLNAVADALEAHEDEIVELGDAETALGPTRLRTELGRTVAQTRFYGEVAREGSYLGLARDETAGNVRINVPLGPVAVFGASNFPLVLGPVGHDPIAALAAGCPVVVKAHDAHVGLSLRLSAIAEEALATAGAPSGSYGTVVGFDAGTALVRAPAIAAVAFTGSERGGRAIWRLANERDTPIPVYAEMGTVNPVVLTAAAVGDLDAIAEEFVACYTANGGQYCSKPGLLFAPAGSGAADRVAAALAAAAPSPTMLTRYIADSVRTGLDELTADGARIVQSIAGYGAGWSAPAAVLAAPMSAIRPGGRLLEECFGAVAVVVEYTDLAEVVEALRTMQPALVAALWTAGGEIPDAEDPDARRILGALAPLVGRLVVNRWTTGAIPGWAQNHGGPWPATSNGAATSIGAASLDRFVRPISYQGVPDAWLPEVARRANPFSVTRRVDGRIEPSPNVISS
ncbi:aldehyde dehydrogenase family protein [Streptomyces sp. NPDC001982]|uniref:aldehyde dehydrogenase family protein n=1 Tax=Streptomyces sp. NPDC001982 TaxID=3154405 RepID=UPI00331993BA